VGHWHGEDIGIFLRTRANRTRNLKGVKFCPLIDSRHRTMGKQPQKVWSKQKSWVALIELRVFCVQWSGTRELFSPQLTTKCSVRLEISTIRGRLAWLTRNKQNSYFCAEHVHSTNKVRYKNVAHVRRRGDLVFGSHTQSYTYKHIHITHTTHGKRVFCIVRHSLKWPLKRTHVRYCCSLRHCAYCYLQFLWSAPRRLRKVLHSVGLFCRAVGK
jgi:hypothetical protein